MTEQRAPEAWSLTAAERATLSAALARIIPADSDPGATEVGAAGFIEQFLSSPDFVHASPDGDGFRALDGRQRAAWQTRIAGMRRLYRAGLSDLDARSQAGWGRSFADLEPERQDEVLGRLERETALHGGKPPANQPVSAEDEPFFGALVLHARQGYLCDPAYGGNRDRAGWNAIGFDGPAHMRDVRDGRYTTRPYLASSDSTPSATNREVRDYAEPAPIAPGRGWLRQSNQEERCDVCIVGTGAGGGMAARVLSQAGLRVVVLERGPWRQPAHFGADELAAFNRYEIWPDPLLHPRTYRSDEKEQARVQPFSPMPALVGGGTIHWSAWMPRPLASDFRPRSEVGSVSGASLVDWPISYTDLEPYIERVENLMGVGGVAGANPYEEPRRTSFPVAPLPASRYGKRFERGCRQLGLSAFRMPQAISPTPYGGRPGSRDNGFVQQYGDSTDAKASTLNTCLRDALATGRLDLRANSFVTRVCVDEHGLATGVTYIDRDGAERSVLAKAVIVAGGAIETARLLLMSATSHHPDGLANASGLVGANLSLHEYTFAIGLFDDGDPIYGWAGSYEGGCSYDFYRHDDRRGHALGCLLSSSGLGHPINFTYPGRPLWGQAAKDADRSYFNHSMKVGVLVQDLPQERNRIDLDPQTRDAWGLPVARVTHRAHPNDLALANWTVDRAAEIAAAAGASTVLPVHIEGITGNCAHQYGTARMGTRPDASVVDPHGRSHEIENLLVLDGSVFPSSSGVNPTLLIMANAWRCCERLLAEGPRRASRTGSTVSETI